MPLLKISAAAPATTPALERMLTGATKAKPHLWQQLPDILTIAKAAGYKTYRISNHSTDRFGIIKLFASHADTQIFTNKGRSRGEGSYDETLLEPYTKALEDDAKRKLIIVHMLGSHPAYDFRYPKTFAKFTKQFDDEVANSLQKAGHSKAKILLRNQYDNTIFYSDYIRHKLLAQLKQISDTELF